MVWFFCINTAIVQSLFFKKGIKLVTTNVFSMVHKYVYKLYNIYEMYIYVYTHSVYNFIVMLQNFILRNTIRILFMFYLL